MGNQIQIDVAELAGVAAEGPLFGLFLALDIFAIRLLLRRTHNNSVNYPLLTAASAMLLLATAQYVVDIANVFMAFIPLDQKARLAFFEDVTQPIYAAKHAIYFTMLLIGDAIVIYRAYIVWSKNIWIVVVPILCSLGSAASAYQTIWAVRHSIDHLNIQLELRMGFVIFSLSFAANAIATCLLGYKIWKAENDSKKMMSVISHRKSRMPIIRILGESGAANTAYLLVYVIIINSGSKAIQIMACIVTPLVGVIFSTVIIRAALAAQPSGSMQSTTRKEFSHPHFPPQLSKNRVESDNDSIVPEESASEMGLKVLQSVETMA